MTGMAAFYPQGAPAIHGGENGHRIGQELID
jgi:hypothetical protein